MTNMLIQPLWLTYFIEILLVLEFQLTKTYFGTFSYKAHFRPQIYSNASFPFLNAEGLLPQNSWSPPQYIKNVYNSANSCDRWHNDLFFFPR